MRSFRAMMRLTQRIVACSCLMSAGVDATRAATHVLAIGINEYDHEPQLAGAVRDAEDIAETFRRLNASVTLLRNREATRERIEAHWRAILARARVGDTVVVTYAGHGGQEPDKAPFDEADGLDEAFLLSGFDRDPRRPGFGERILDDTIHDWFDESEAQGLKIILVADACYSGTMTRGLPDPRAVVALRGSAPYGLPETLPLSQVKENAAEVTRATMTPKEAEDEANGHVTLLSATQENRNAPEVVIDGKSRGALSYAFARAVEGAADANHDGIISLFELEAFISRQVRQLSEAQQSADVWPSRGSDQTLFDVPTPTHGEEHSNALGKLKLSVFGLAPDEAQNLAKRFDGIELAAAGESTDLVWDKAAQMVISGIGDPVAYDVTAAGLQGVIDKWRLLAFLKHKLSTRALDINLEPDDRRHVEGSKITIYSAPLELPYVTVIDIAPDGALRLLYPIPSDPPRWPIGQPYRVDNIEVREPYGADHVLLIASDKPLPTLHTSLRTLATAQLPILLEQELAGADYRIALLGLYTVSNRESK